MSRPAACTAAARARRSLFLSLFSVMLGCAGGPAGELGGHERRNLDVVGGQPSTPEQDSVVLLVREDFESWSTGVVVAPTLIMTSRHFLYEAQLGENDTLLCGEQGRTTPVVRVLDATTVNVHAGSARPLPRAGVRGVKVYSGNELDLCENDIALLEVDGVLPVAPLALRLDEPPSAGEEGILVGWGATLEDVQTSAYQYLTDARQQRAISILAVGPTLYTPPESTIRALEGSVFMGTEGGCMGDSGSPLISTLSGAIIGIENAVQNSDPVIGLQEADDMDQCIGAFTMFQRLDVQNDWIRNAFQSVGSAPWLEGAQQPAPFGSSCSSEHDCLSGICITTRETGFCSERCDRRACPDGSACVGSGSGRLCSIKDIAGATVDGGCSLAPTWRQPWSSALAVLAFASAWAYRRLRPSRPAARGR